MSLLKNFINLFHEKAVENIYWNREDEGEGPQNSTSLNLPDPERHVRKMRANLGSWGDREVHMKYEPKNGWSKKPKRAKRWDEL